MRSQYQPYLGHITIELGIQQIVGQFLSFVFWQILHFLTSEGSHTPTLYTKYHYHIFINKKYTHLHSANQHTLFVPAPFGPRAFCSSGPLSWNVLPSHLLDPAISISIFRHPWKLICSTVILIDCVSFDTYMYSVFSGSVTAHAFVTVSV